MKILFLASDLGVIGGIQQYNRNFLRAVRENGKDIIFAVEFKGGVFYRKPRFAVKFLLSLFRFRPDLIICGHINFFIFGYLAKKIFGIDYAIFTHGIEVWNLKNFFHIKAIKAAKIITTVSSYTKKKIIEQVPDIENKIFTLFNSINGKQFKIQEKSPSLLDKYGLDGKKVILTVARLSVREKYKGYDQIIRSLPRVISKIPNARYILVGSGDDASRIKKLASDIGMENYVIFAGSVETKELIDYYNIADVFVMPSKGEGFGIVFLEALACGKPVIAGNQDGSREAVLNGELGVLIDPDDIEEIAKSIIGVFKKEIPNKLSDGQYLRKRVLEVYGFDKFKEKVKNLIYELSR